MSATSDTIKSAGKFAETLNVFTGIPGKRIDLVMRKFSFRALDAVFRFSPVDSGLFRGSWNTAIGSPDKSRFQRKDFPRKSVIPQGAPLFGRPLDKFNKVKTQIKADSVVYITNTQPYSVLLERGRSAQAPQGVIRPAVSILQNVIARMVAEAKREVPDA